MKKLAAPFLLALMSVFFAVPGCSTVNPYLRPIASCAGKSVAAADVNEAFGDLLTQNWADLTAEGTRIGFDILACIIADITTQTPGLAPAAATFKSLHAVEFRAAGVSCNDSATTGVRRGDVPRVIAASTPGQRSLATATAPTTSSPSSLELSLASCAAACGTPDAIAPPSGCECWRASKTDWRKSRWVALAGR